MKTWFIDSNVLIRFFTEDDAGQTERAAALLKSAADGKVRLVCGPPVLFEVAWTLRSAYRVSPARILQALRALFALPGMEFTDAAVVGEAISLASRTGGEFADAYIATIARAAGCDGVATFNIGDFARLGSPVAEL